MKKIVNILIVFFVLMIFGFFYYKCEDVISKTSVTYDEAVHLMQGYSYLKTGSLQTVAYWDQPMLAKILNSIGLFFLRPQPLVYVLHDYWIKSMRYSFANIMLYYNNQDADIILTAARRTAVIISIILGLSLVLIVKQTFGLYAALFSSLLYTFSSVIIANSCLVTQDIIISGLYLLGFYYFFLFINSKSRKESLLAYIACSVIAGLSISTKFSAIVLFLSWLFIGTFFVIRKEISLHKFLIFWVYVILIGLVIILIIYNFNIKVFFISFIETLKKLQEGRSTFLVGKFSAKGFPEYFLIAFLIKTEISFLFLILASIFLSIFRIIKKKEDLLDYIMLFSILIYFTIASFSRTQIGIRHLLPVYFLSIWYVSRLFTIRKIRFFLIPLIFWYILSSVNVHPWYLSYFNECIGGPKNGYKYLTDSNIDWGQGLKELGRWLNKNEQLKDLVIYLSYFGVGDPHYYKIKYKPILLVNNLTEDERKGDNVKHFFNKNNRIILAVSVTNLQCTYFLDKNIFDFLKKLEPIKKIAYSILVYDITDNLSALKEFSKLLLKLGYVVDANFIDKHMLKK